MKKEIKNSNRGFTIVELIIVMAIMAILVALVSPFFTRYIEKSRRSSDMDTARGIMDVLTICYNDGTITFGDTDGNSGVWVFVTENGANIGAGGDTAFHEVSGSNLNDQFATLLEAHGLTASNLRLNSKVVEDTGDPKTDDGWTWYCVYVSSTGEIAAVSNVNNVNAGYISSFGDLSNHVLSWTDRFDSPMARATQP